MRLPLSWPIALALFALPARGANEASAANATATTDAVGSKSSPDASRAALTKTAELRDEYLFGDRMVIPITIRNDGTAPVRFPDLASRPWLVRFRFRLPNGHTQDRYTTPPSSDPGQTWLIPARGQRRVLLEVPSGGRMKPGEYVLTVILHLDSGDESIATRTVHIATPHPVMGDLGADLLVSPKSSPAALWVHQAHQGYDLYLNRASARGAPRNLYLTHLDRRITPVLTTGRISGAGGRHAVWLEGSRSLAYVAITPPVQAGSQAAGAPKRVDAPWPKVELAGRGATDGSGTLQQPLWVPGPRGRAGELRLLAIRVHGAPAFQRIARFEARPDQVVAVVDDAGVAHFLVRHGAFVDLYTARTPDSAASLPVPGRRVFRAGEGTEIVDARFDILPKSPDRAGGLAILVIEHSGGALQPRWLSLHGASLHAAPPVPWNNDDILLHVLPVAGSLAAGPGILYRDAPGMLHYHEGDVDTVVPAPTGTWTLLRSPGTGQPVIERLVPGGPLTQSGLEP